jgi:competence protein ComEA
MRKLRNNNKSVQVTHQHSIWYDITRNLTEYFSFNRLERLSVVSLSIVCLLFILIPQIWAHLKVKQKTDYSMVLNAVKAFKSPVNTAEIQANKVQSLFNFNPNEATFEDFMSLGLSEKLSNTILNYRDKGGKFYDEGDFQKMYGLTPNDFERLAPYIVLEKSNYPQNKNWDKKDWDKKDWDKKESAKNAESFPFDPNNVSASELIRLGLSEKQAAVWVKYRSAGAKFKTPADIKKLYCITENDYARLAPLVKIENNNPNDAFASNTSNPRPQNYSGSGSTAFNANKLSTGQTIDINKANQEDWQKIPQIGAIRAKSIVDYRDKLGGFASVNQLGEMRQMPDSIFQVIKPFLKVETSVYRKINLNTASFEELEMHPMIDKKQASLIVAYRAQHGKFESTKGIGAILAFTDKIWLDKISAYLSVD